MSILLLLFLIMPVQYSAYSGVPFPNCLDILDDKTVVLHWVGSCGDSPFWENLRYYSDQSYHVQSTTTHGDADWEAKLVYTGYPTTYRDALIELNDKLGITK